jgi:GST-like protein
MGSAPFIGGGFGHFYVYAPERYKYPIDRYAMETKRLFDVADRQLAKTEYLAGADYTIADIAAYTWLGNLYHGAYNGSDKFLGLHEYANVGRWVKAIDARPARSAGGWSTPRRWPSGTRRRTSTRSRTAACSSRCASAPTLI